MIPAFDLLHRMPPSTAPMSDEAKDLRARLLRALLEGRPLAIDALAPFDAGTLIPPTITSGLR
jgi:hypothetical protein